LALLSEECANANQPMSAIEKVKKSCGFVQITSARVSLLCGAMLGVIGCASSPRQTPDPAPAAPQTASAQGNVARSDSAIVMPPLSQFTRMGTGLMYYDVSIGTGLPAVDLREVELHYVGYLESGQIFDNSRTRGQPIKFVLGQGRVIPGWEQGVRGMRPGGQRILVIPPALAYGAAGKPPVIPSNATLIFTLTLISVR